MAEILSVLSGFDPIKFLIWSFAITILVVFWKWHLNPTNGFNIMDLICEDGKLSSSKFMRTGSWAVMSFGFYILSIKYPESLVAYAPLYGGIWVSARALDKWQQNNAVNVNSTHTETESTTQSTLMNITLTPEQKDKLRQDCYQESK